MRLDTMDSRQPSRVDLPAMEAASYQAWLREPEAQGLGLHGGEALPPRPQHGVAGKSPSAGVFSRRMDSMVDYRPLLTPSHFAARCVASGRNQRRAGIDYSVVLCVA